MKIQVQKNGKSVAQKRAAPLADSQLVNSNNPKKVYRSSSDPHKKLFPDEAPSTSGSKGNGSVAPSSQVLPKKKTETIWHMGNVCEHSLRQICKLDTKQPNPEDVQRWRTVEAICMRLKDIDVPGNIGRVQGPVSFDEIFEVLGLDEEGNKRKETRMDPFSSELKAYAPAVQVPVESLFSDLPYRKGKGNNF